MDDLTKALNAAGFLMSSARVTNGRLKLQFLKNTYRGTKMLLKYESEIGISKRC